LAQRHASARRNAVTAPGDSTMAEPAAVALPHK